jgi:hypothetical protein
VYELSVVQAARGSFEILALADIEIDDIVRRHRKDRCPAGDRVSGREGIADLTTMPR